MKKLLIVLSLLLIVPTMALGSDFVPTKLEISASEVIQYNFDGSNLEIPINITGTQARLVFLVYTKDKGEEIGELRNGYLGWHYVNGIDTCIYVSHSYDYGQGDDTVVWDGKDNDGGIVEPGDYTYYMWAYDYASAKQKATHNMIKMGRNRLNLVPFGEDGLPLEQPVIYTVPNGTTWGAKWTIGNDTENDSLLETTDLAIPSEWQWLYNGQLALNPDDYNTVYFAVQRDDPRTKAVWKYTWVPAGDAVRDTEWSNELEWSATFDMDCPVITDGEYLYTSTYAQATHEPASEFYIIDFDGTMIDRFMLEWWISQDESDRGGAMNGGPRLMSHDYGGTFLNNYFCLQQQVDPLRYLETGNMEDFTVWCNLNGDYFDDLLFEETADRPWVCFGGSAAEITSCHSDRYYFTQTPQYDMGAVSFVLMGPDGTGIEYFAFAGETAGYKKRQRVCTD